MPVSEQQGDGLDAIEAATTMPALERAFLAAATRSVDADVYGICQLDADLKITSVAAIDVPNEFVEHYEAEERDSDSIFAHIVRRGEPVHDRALFDRRQWLREPLADFLSEWGYERCMQAPVFLDGALHSTLHFNRVTGRRPFTPRDLHTVWQLQQRVRRQLQHLAAERELSRARRLCSSLLEHVPAPAVVTTATGALVQVNHAAELIVVSYRAKPALWPEYRAAVRANIEALETPGDPGGDAIARRQGADGLAYRVHTTVVERDDLFLSLFHPVQVERPRSLALGPREQVIANLVAEGYTNERIAATLNLSVNTVKDYLKRINRKLGTANRAQLAAWWIRT